MINKITITNYLGDILKLDLRKPEKSGFLVAQISGLGPCRAQISTTEVSTNDGSLYNMARLNQRNLVFSFIFTETTNGETIEDIRQKSYKYFPIKKEVTLQFETKNRNVQTIGYVETNEPNIFSSREGTQISIICPDPYLYSAGVDEYSTEMIYGAESMFEFPFSNESAFEPMIIFGELQNKKERVVTYKGDSDIGVILNIHITGPTGSITIYNATSREIMYIDNSKIESFTGSGLKLGDDIIINTQKGYKSVTLVRDGLETNIFNCLQKGSDWISLKKGINIFALDVEINIENLIMEIKHKVLYEGV